MWKGWLVGTIHGSAAPKVLDTSISYSKIRQVFYIIFPDYINMRNFRKGRSLPALLYSLFDKVFITFKYSFYPAVR
jgi:hypothetical protein